MTPTSFAVIIITCFFIYITKESWREVVKRAAIIIKNKFFTIDTTKDEQRKVQKIKKSDKESRIARQFYKEVEQSQEKIKELEKRSNSIFELWKFYMFSYFNLYLVLSTKFALLWLFNNPNSTKEIWLFNMTIPQSVQNQQLEKEAIFNALISNNLVLKNVQDLYFVSNIGIDFLKFIGFVKL